MARRKRGHLTSHDVSKHFIPVFHRDFPFFPKLPGPLYREISARGIKPSELPGDTEWHAREMTVTDPDGNKLRFSTAASE